MHDWGLQSRIRDTVRTNEIQAFQEQAAVNILVGFLSGRMHVETQHQNENGEYINYNGEKAQPQTVEAAELAEALHDGTATIPARPFLDEGIEVHKEELSEAIMDELEKVLEGNKANWDKVATMAVGAIQEFVRSDHYKNSVPNSQKTIDYKGSDTPLIDGGDLINSMEYVIQGKK